jgi:selenocysteine-specific elongation factor
LDAIVQQLAAQDRIILNSEGLAHPNWSGKLTARQSDVSKTMIAACQEAGLRPPTVGEFANSYSFGEEEIESLLQLAANSEVLIRLPDKETRDSKAARRSRIFLHRAEERKLIERVRTMWTASDAWSVSEFREAFGLSRKYAVPLCEHLDKLGITIRSGDRRHVNPLESAIRADPRTRV